MRTPAEMQLQYAQTFGAVKAIEDLSRLEHDKVGQQYT